MRKVLSVGIPPIANQTAAPQDVVSETQLTHRVRYEEGKDKVGNSNNSEPETLHNEPISNNEMGSIGDKVPNSEPEMEAGIME